MTERSMRYADAGSAYPRAPARRYRYWSSKPSGGVRNTLTQSLTRKHRLVDERARPTKSPAFAEHRRHAKDCDRRGRCECAYVVVHDGKMRTFPNMTEAREGKRIMQRQAKLSTPTNQVCIARSPATAVRAAMRGAHAAQRIEPPLSRLRPRLGGALSRHGASRIPDRRLLKAYALDFFARDLRVRQIDPR
jgi:hypothetical protein